MESIRNKEFYTVGGKYIENALKMVFDSRVRDVQTPESQPKVNNLHFNGITNYTY